MYKICSKCKETKQSKSFYKNSKGKDGLRASCKACDYGLNKSRKASIERKCNRCKKVKPLNNKYFLERDNIKSGYSFKCIECIITCNQCNITKTLEDFAKNNSMPTGISNRCRDCQKAYTDRYHDKVKNVKKAKYRRQRNALFISRVKMKLGCQKCNYKEHPSALDFDHLDPNTKNSNDYSAMNSNWSRKRIKEEMRKCRIFCANCHRIHSHGRHYHSYPGLTTPVI